MTGGSHHQVEAARPRGRCWVLVAETHTPATALGGSLGRLAPHVDGFRPNPARGPVGFGIGGLEGGLHGIDLGNLVELVFQGVYALDQFGLAAVDEKDDHARPGAFLALALKGQVVAAALGDWSG